MGEIIVKFDPEESKKLAKMNAESFLWTPPEENAKSAYCPISLTSTPDEIMPFLSSRQDALMQKVLEAEGITAYDPTNAPVAESVDPNIPSKKVFIYDIQKILGSRYIVGHNLFPSFGYGVESMASVTFNKVPVILMDKKIRPSTMIPSRTILLEYDQFVENADAFRPVIAMLEQFEPAIGFNNKISTLLGFEKNNGTKIVDLEEEISKNFPDLEWKLDGKIPKLQLRVMNPWLFSEYNSGTSDYTQTK